MNRAAGLSRLRSSHRQNKIHESVVVGGYFFENPGLEPGKNFLQIGINRTATVSIPRFQAGPYDPSIKKGANTKK